MLNLERLSTDHPKRPLRGLDAQFQPGRIYTILGRTGAGKTELLRTLIGLDPISGGAIRLDGADLARVPVRSRQMAMVYQQFINYPHLDVLQNVAFPLRRQRMGRATAEAKAREALRLVGLEGFEARKPSALSGGQQQRVALARAIAKQARILLMDEPLANLDYKLREQLREEFPRLLHRNADSIILYTTTEPAEAMQLGDEMIVMHDGRIVAQGDPGALFDAPPSVEVARVISDPPISIIPAIAEDGALGLGDGTRLALPGLPAGATGPVQLGIRPDALGIGDGIAATVTLAEFSGSDSIVHLRLPFGEAVMLLEGIHDIAPGAGLGVTLDPGRLLVFAADGTFLTKGQG